MNNLYNPEVLKNLCQKYGLTPSKRYGQNYLINSEIVDQIIEASDLSNKDTVLEIGSGFGVLTLALAEKAKKVITFEIEKKIERYWDEILNQVQDDTKNIEMIWGNILKFDIEELKIKDYKLVANLPYQITSAVIRKFLETANKPKIMVLMVQKEVAERICAQPGKMSLLAVSVQCYAEAKIITKVPNSYFWPQPKVDSAIIKLSVFDNSHLVEPDENFFKIVKAGFSSKRKLLLNNLMGLLGKDKKIEILKILKKVGINDKARAQDLSIQQWHDLTRELKV